MFLFSLFGKGGEQGLKGAVGYFIRRRSVNDILTRKVLPFFGRMVGRNKMENKKAVVIGAGVSGLCAAVELKRLGFEVTVLEKASRAGGVMDTFSEGGFRAESGSNSVMVQSQKTLDFLSGLGLADEVEYPQSVAKKRFFARYGKARAVPMGPVQLIFTRLFTPLGKIRLFFEPFVKPDAPDSDPSVADFTVRRLGRDALDYGMNPFMGGVYGGDPEKLSVRHAIPQFWNLVQKYGSIFRGAFKSRADKMAAGNYFKPVMISFKGGMKTFIDRMVETLGDSLKTDAKILSVDSDNEGGWAVSWGNDIEDSCEQADVLVLAVPAHEIGKIALCGNLSSALRPLSRITYAPVATLTLGFARKDVGHKLDGFGVLLPQKEKFSILGSLFVSSIFSDRAPDGFVTLTNYVGGMRNPKLARLPEAEMEKIVMEDLRKLLKVRGEPVFRKLFFWPQAIAQYNVGYQEFVDAVNSAESTYDNLAVIGSFRGGVGVSSCIENAISAAGRLCKNL